MICITLSLFSPARAQQPNPAAPAAVPQINTGLTAVAGVDRVVVLPGKTYLNGYAGYGFPPRQDRRRGAPVAPSVASGPAPAATWSKTSGPGKVAITVNPKAGKRFSVRVRVPDRSVSTLYESAPAANGIRSISVNGTAVKPAIANGYAVVTRTWKTGDKITLDLPMKVQRITPSGKILTTQGRVALRYGPLVYDIEKADQDITQVLNPGSPLTAEWRGDLLGGVMTIKGVFANGSAMLAIPNYARNNRIPAAAPAEPQAAAGAAPRTGPRPPTSIVWIKAR